MELYNPLLFVFLLAVLLIASKFLGLEAGVYFLDYFFISGIYNMILISIRNFKNPEYHNDGGIIPFWPLMILLFLSLLADYFIFYLSSVVLFLGLLVISVIVCFISYLYKWIKNKNK